MGKGVWAAREVGSGKGEGEEVAVRERTTN